MSTQNFLNRSLRHCYIKCLPNCQHIVQSQMILGSRNNLVIFNILFQNFPATRSQGLPVPVHGDFFFHLSLIIHYNVELDNPYKNEKIEPIRKIRLLRQDFGGRVTHQTIFAR